MAATARNGGMSSALSQKVQRINLCSFNPVAKGGRRSLYAILGAYICGTSVTDLQQGPYWHADSLACPTDGLLQRVHCEGETRRASCRLASTHLCRVS